tara:strand:+ start:1772 stop:2413 length:642 start_codon:yes stop_codon:yes gene_type:complete
MFLYSNGQMLVDTYEKKTVYFGVWNPLVIQSCDCLENLLRIEATHGEIKKINEKHYWKPLPIGEDKLIIFCDTIVMDTVNIQKRYIELGDLEYQYWPVDRDGVVSFDISSFRELRIRLNSKYNHLIIDNSLWIKSYDIIVFETNRPIDTIAYVYNDKAGSASFLKQIRGLKDGYYIEVKNLVLYANFKGNGNPVFFSVPNETLALRRRVRQSK